jgi:hypothetical protein
MVRRGPDSEETGEGPIESGRPSRPIRALPTGGARPAAEAAP